MPLPLAYDNRSGLSRPSLLGGELEDTDLPMGRKRHSLVSLRDFGHVPEPGAEEKLVLTLGRQTGLGNKSYYYQLPTHLFRRGERLRLLL